jgi:hypothetical protein
VTNIGSVRRVVEAELETKGCGHMASEIGYRLDERITQGTPVLVTVVRPHHRLDPREALAMMAAWNAAYAAQGIALCPHGYQVVCSCPDGSTPDFTRNEGAAAQMLESLTSRGLRQSAPPTP